MNYDEDESDLVDPTSCGMVALAAVVFLMLVGAVIGMFFGLNWLCEVC